MEFKKDKKYLILGTVKTGTHSLQNYLASMGIIYHKTHDVMNREPIQGVLDDDYIPLITTRNPLDRCISDWYHFGCLPTGYNKQPKDYVDWLINKFDRPWWKKPSSNIDRSDYNLIFDYWEDYDYETISLEELQKLPNFPHNNTRESLPHQEHIIPLTQEEINITNNKLKEREI